MGGNGACTMAILVEQTLEFAREHLTKFYDSDFFPNPPEFNALWHVWGDVKAELLSKNVGKFWVAPPRAMAIPKPKGVFRVVHQLEPLESVIYTALACQIAPSIEKARMPIDEHIACSYRLSISDGSFFSSGSGWTEFGNKTEELAASYTNVLATDITDFYNQTYLHRLNNAIELADDALKPIASEIENFLMTLNSKTSQGLPVGPAASIVMAEAVLIDVDRFIRDQGLQHTRYVDDIRIFSDSKRELSKALEKLTLYLYENHRLTISSEKTLIADATEFVQKQLHNPFAEEKNQLLEALGILAPYPDEFAEESEIADNAQLLAAIEKVSSYEYVDLSLARSIIRTARRQCTPILAQHLLAHFDFFAPAVNDVIRYLHEITDADADLAGELRPVFESLLSAQALDNPLVRLWVEWYLAQYPAYLGSSQIHQYIFGGPNLENQSIAAITTKNVAWVRNHKTSVYNVGGRERRAILNAARVLPSDERNPWLKIFMTTSPAQLDRWVAKWVQETS
jgi:hypothetical protein